MEKNSRIYDSFPFWIKIISREETKKTKKNKAERVTHSKTQNKHAQRKQPDTTTSKKRKLMNK